MKKKPTKGRDMQAPNRYEYGAKGAETSYAGPDVRKIRGGNALVRQAGRNVKRKG